jgi:hypothetical protein
MGRVEHTLLDPLRELLLIASIKIALLGLAASLKLILLAMK